MTITATKRLEWDSAHRITQHESKCWNLHGHRYAAEITCEIGAETASYGGLDGMGMVVDFGVIKSKVGAWIDDKWDHGTIANETDTDLISYVTKQGYKLFIIDQEPTAEVLAMFLLNKAQELLQGVNGITVTSVTIYETPTSRATASR